MTRRRSRRLRPRTAGAPHRRHHQRRGDAGADLRRAATTDSGLKQTDIGFWCSGSSDYLAGRAFSFVSAVDAIGAVPPVNESHVEMDAAWALYEAWSRSRPARSTPRWSTGSASPRPACCAGCSRCSSTRTRSRRCGRTRCRSPACRPGSGSTPASGRASRWPRWRWTRCAAPSATEYAEMPGEVSGRRAARPAVLRRPAAPHDCAPVTDGAAAIVLAAGDRARELRERPAWITGFEHRIEPRCWAPGT